MNEKEAQRFNQLNWNDRVAGHLDGYDIAALVADVSRLSTVVDFDRGQLPDVSGKTLLHSQCHIGTDTLSWGRLGASVTGFDFSPDAIGAARDLAKQMNVDATFVEIDVANARTEIDGTFDIVYTSVGTICWLKDLKQWGQMMASFCKPGGVVYIRDGHPMAMALDDERTDEALVVKYPYFHQSTPMMFESDQSYVGDATLTQTKAYCWFHSLSDVINAFIEAGLLIENVQEHRFIDWQFLKQMNKADGVFRLPATKQDLVPLQFSIRARKPI